MLYLTVEDLKSRYPRISQNVGVTSAQLSAYVDEAGGEGDGYLAQGGYTVPVSPAPAVLVGKVAALAWGMFLQRNQHEADREGGVSALMKDVRDWFQKVADGKVSLVGSGGAALAGQSVVAPWSSVEGFKPTFGAGNIDNDEVDPERILDEEE